MFASSSASHTISGTAITMIVPLTAEQRSLVNVQTSKPNSHSAQFAAFACSAEAGCQVPALFAHQKTNIWMMSIMCVLTCWV